MGPRKGKKAWKKIDTQDVEDFLEKSTREERQGLAFEAVPDADLFFVDKGAEGAAPEPAAAAAGDSKQPKKKLTRAQAILQGAHSAKPVVPHVQRKRKQQPAPQPKQQQQQQQQQQQKGGPQRGKQPGAAFDLWAEEPLVAPAGAAVVPAGAGASASKRRRTAAAASERSREVVRPAAPPVEIDLPGCSYNPDREQHQDAVALAVAAEMSKVYAKDVEPVAPPTLVDYEPESDELALLQTLEEGAGEEEEEEEEEGAGGAAEGGGDDEGAGRRQPKASERKTRKDRNREKRRREAEGELAERRRLKAQRRELERLPALAGEVEEALAEQEEARRRKQLDRQERVAGEAPRLGKQRFEPAPVQVLASDEITGSLRRLKPTAMLAKDRFKSLQKRGLIEPRRKVAKKSGKKVLYEQGARWEREKEGQQSIDEARKQIKKKKKAAGGS